MITLPALLTGVFAQSCVAMLPPARAEVVWFRDGNLHARDVPLRTSRTERVYRREPAAGAAVERSLSCVTMRGTSYLLDRVAGSTVRLPIPLAVGATATVEGATVRRIPAPADAGAEALWYTVSNPGVSMYGLRAGVGVAEVRSPGAGGFTVTRAVVRDPAPDSAAIAVAVRASADSQRTALELHIATLEQTVATLRDSIAALLPLLEPPPVPFSSPAAAEFTAIQVYFEREDYQRAAALLLDLRDRLERWSERNGTRHRALDAVDERMDFIISVCLPPRDERSGRAPQPCAGSGRPPPFTFDQIQRLLQGTTPADTILADVRRACIAFRWTTELDAALARAGAPADFAAALRSACFRGSRDSPEADA
jgi:hypothetical protein